MPDNSDSLRQPDEEASSPPDLHDIQFLDPVHLQPRPPSEGAVLLAEIVAEEVTPEPPRPSFAWALLWCLLFIAVTQVVPGMIAGVLLIFLVGITPEGMNRLENTKALLASPEYTQAMFVALLMSQILSILMGVMVVRMIVGRGWPRILALRWPSPGHFVLGLVGLPGLIVVAMGVEGAVKEYLPKLIDLEDTMALFGHWPWPLGVLIIGVGPGIGEELWCRGFLGRGLVGRHGYLGGLLLTSLLFGLIHLDPVQATYTMVMGMVLHASYLFSRSLLIPMALHTANNSLAVLMMHIPFFQALNDPNARVPGYVVAAAALLLVAVGWAFFKSRARLVDFPGEGGSRWRPMFPGVAYPPPRSSTRVMHPRPNLQASILVLGTVVIFVGTIFLASQ